MSALLCRIELDQTKGITITVQNDDGKITQTVEMDGKAMTLTCKGSSDTSKIVQKPDSIAITCKHFSVDAEDVSVKSSKQTKHQSGTTYDIKSGGNMTVAVTGNLKESATAKASLSAANVESAAKASSKISGLTVAVDAKTKASVSGLQLAFSGKTQAQMSAPMTKVSGQAKLDLTGALTTVQGTLTSVKGALVKLG